MSAQIGSMEIVDVNMSAVEYAEKLVKEALEAGAAHFIARAQDADGTEVAIVVHCEIEAIIPSAELDTLLAAEGIEDAEFTESVENPVLG